MRKNQLPVVMGLSDRRMRDRQLHWDDVIGSNDRTCKELYDVVSSSLVPIDNCRCISRRFRLRHLCLEFGRKAGQIVRQRMRRKEWEACGEYARPQHLAALHATPKG